MQPQDRSHLLSFFVAKHVLVTGGAGFIGSHLVAALSAAGAKVTVIDNFLTGQRQNLDGIECQLFAADLNEGALASLPAAYRPDCVFHLASPASPPKYQAHPVATYLVNSYATHQLLSYLRQQQPTARFLFASTSEVYGDPAVHPQAESYWGNVNPNGIRSCYDEAKRLGETICGVHARDLGMDVRIVRIFNTYGPRMDLADGRVIPSFISDALRQQPLKIFGDGSQTRSYCYVDDLVDGLLLMMSSAAAAGETVNLGNPGEFTILETARLVAKTVGRVTQRPVTAEALTYLPLPQDDPLRRRPDIRKAQQLLGWQPDVTFAEGLERTVRYFAEPVA